MEFEKLVRERYSVRKFSDRHVEENAVQAILNAARVAPTAGNRQPQRILILRDAESMAQLKECTAYTFDAPLALVVCCRTEEAWVRPFDNFNEGIVDAAIVGTHIMLAVHNLGLGSTWVAHFDPVLLRRKFAIPEGIKPVAIFPVGYPAPDAKPAPRHEQRRPLDETVVYDKF